VAKTCSSKSASSYLGSCVFDRLACQWKRVKRADEREAIRTWGRVCLTGWCVSAEESEENRFMQVSSKCLKTVVAQTGQLESGGAHSSSLATYPSYRWSPSGPGWQFVFEPGSGLLPPPPALHVELYPWAGPSLPPSSGSIHKSTTPGAKVCVCVRARACV
jgi:hypothetical protein